MKMHALDHIPPYKDTVIACMGDSITFSLNASSTENTYPAVLQTLLGEGYRVGNYGRNGATTISDFEWVANAPAPYIKSPEYQLAKEASPDIVILMLGMNDFNLNLYTSVEAQNPEEESERERLFFVHMREYEKIIIECKKAGSNVIICLPTPYDEVSKCDTESKFYQSALDKACDFQLEMANKYGCRVVNFKDNMMSMLETGIIQKDRVHPTEYGYHVMAQIFLK